MPFFKDLLDKLDEVVEIIDEHVDKVKGPVVGIAMNAAKFTVEVGNGTGRTILNIFDNTVTNLRGNPRMWLRYDIPHTSTPYHHININPAYTGVPDPHLEISAAHANMAGYAGSVLDFLNSAAPYLTAIVAAYELITFLLAVRRDYIARKLAITNGDASIKPSLLDILKSMTWEHTIKWFISRAGSYGGGFAGTMLGATIGTWCLPGIGTLFGAIIGGAIVGILGGMLGRWIGNDSHLFTAVHRGEMGVDLYSDNSKIKSFLKKVKNAFMKFFNFVKNGIDKGISSWKNREKNHKC